MASSPISAEPPGTVALTGATGIVGQFVRHHLKEVGIQVRGLARAPAPATDDVEWHVGSMADRGSLNALCAEANALVHCAFAHVPGRYRGGEGDNPGGFWRDNLGGTVNVLESARQAGVQRVVLLSSRAVFGSATDAPPHVADDTPTSPDTHYGALKVATETLAQSYSATHDSFTVTCLRPTGIYGLIDPPERSKWFAHARAALAGEAITEVRSATEVHGLDVADAVYRLLTADAEDVRGQAFNCSDLLLSTREIAMSLAARTGSDAPLPAIGEPPRNQMTCAGLKRLGWQGGGRARFESTLDELVRAAQATTTSNRSSNADMQ